MTERLDIHPANRAEQIEAYRNTHDVWGRGLSLEDHVQRRLASVQHNRARWFVGTFGGRVVTSLGCYPLRFCLRGEIVPGIAIGAVHTLADYRGRGFARQLLTWVEHFAAEKDGVELSLLYSDIAPDYYARLGYRECPSCELNVSRDDIEAAHSFSRSFPLSAGTTFLRAAHPETPLLRTLYETSHAGLPLYIHRDEDYWNYAEQKGRLDELFLICGTEKEPQGYVRTALQEGRLLLRDVALPGMEEADGAAWRTVLAAVLQVARQCGAERISGWVPPFSEETDVLPVRQRKQEITMLKPLQSSFLIDESLRQAAGFLHELDHV